MKVLVVDDSKIIRNIIKNILSDRHITDEMIFEAADGHEALNILSKNKIDLLLLDWNMPRINGLELVKSLRALDDYAALPIIMVTSEAARYNVVEAIKAGVNDYVIKPVTAKTVLEKVDKYVKDRRR